MTSSSWHLLNLSLSSSSSTSTSSSLRRRKNDYSSFSCRCSATSSPSSTASSSQPLKAAAPEATPAPMKSIPNPPPAPPPPPPSQPSPPPASPIPNSKKESNISRIQVPRQKYIPVSKSRLLEALLTNLGAGAGGGGDSLISDFLRLSSSLDSILHAEHKKVLEEMRADYLAIHPEGGVDSAAHADGDSDINGVDESESMKKLKLGEEEEEKEEDENQLPFLNGLDFFQLFGSSTFQKNGDQYSRYTNHLHWL